MGKAHFSYKHEYDSMRFTRYTVAKIALAKDRAEVDQYINEYFGYIRTITRLFLEALNFNITTMHRDLAKALQDALTEYHDLPPDKQSGTVGYAEALKFALEKLSYDEVKNIRY